MATALDRRALISQSAAPTASFAPMSGGMKTFKASKARPAPARPAPAGKPTGGGSKPYVGRPGTGDPASTGLQARSGATGSNTSASSLLPAYGISATGASLTPAAPAAGGAPAGVTIPGANDPAFLAYLRQFGIDEAMAQLMAGNNISALERELARALPAFAERRANDVRDTGANYESNGLFRSGSRVVQQAEAGRAVDREQQDFQSKIYDQIRSELINTASEIAALRRELMERGLDYATADAIARAQAGL